MTAPATPYITAEQEQARQYAEALAGYMACRAWYNRARRRGVFSAYIPTPFDGDFDGKHGPPTVEPYPALRGRSVSYNFPYYGVPWNRISSGDSDSIERGYRIGWSGPEPLLMLPDHPDNTPALRERAAAFRVADVTGEGLPDVRRAARLYETARAWYDRTFRALGRTDDDPYAARAPVTLPDGFGETLVAEVAMLIRCVPTLTVPPLEVAVTAIRNWIEEMDAWITLARPEVDHTQTHHWPPRVERAQIDPARLIFPPDPPVMPGLVFTRKEIDRGGAYALPVPPGQNFDRGRSPIDQPFHLHGSPLRPMSPAPSIPHTPGDAPTDYPPGLGFDPSRYYESGPAIQGALGGMADLGASSPTGGDGLAYTHGEAKGPIPMPYTHGEAKGPIPMPFPMPIPVPVDAMPPMPQGFAGLAAALRGTPEKDWPQVVAGFERRADLGAIRAYVQDAGQIPALLSCGVPPDVIARVMASRDVARLLGLSELPQAVGPDGAPVPFPFEDLIAIAASSMAPMPIPVSGTTPDAPDAVSSGVSGSGAYSARVEDLPSDGRGTSAIGGTLQAPPCATLRGPGMVSVRGVSVVVHPNGSVEVFAS